ncbi:MAG TPA: ABC transporter ATP-binding protein [Candidatus Onthovicinus excrementipullorum]|nr:ABC transporter ATP-binding protein [Candidatus Onthovicinus excrementipullorum]
MIVNAQNLVKRYGELVALDHFTLQVEEGEILGLLGPNGSGKTTAINCILSLLEYDRGTIELFGKPMRPDAYDLKRQIGIVMQEVAVFDELTVQENIDYFCGLYVCDKKRRRELVEEAIAFTGLEAHRKFRPKKLSGGLLRRLNIACGIAHRPKLIFFDEPTVAVDPQSRNSILEGIKRLNREGATIVYTSHYMEEVELLCSRIMIMDQGRTIASGTKEDLKAMVGANEKISVELLAPSPDLVREISRQPFARNAALNDNILTIYCSSGAQNLLQVMDYFRSHSITFGKVYSEPPTLNDVFLEITGKHLRN